MRKRTQVILASVNLVAVLVLIVLVLVMFTRLPAGKDEQVQGENKDQIEKISSVAFLANLCDEAGDECRPILYHPQGGGQGLEFD